MKSKRLKRFIHFVRVYFIFFALFAFVITSCMMLYLNVFGEYAGIEFTTENIRMAAIYTFFNVVFLAFAVTVFDYLREKVTVNRPLKEIVWLTERFTKGDFNAKIEKKFWVNNVAGYNEIVEHLDKMALELSSIETLRKDFVANVSHEIKTPLAVMQNYCVLLQQPDLSEEKRVEYTSALLRTTQNLSSLITNILKLNKLENQNIYPDFQKFSISEQVCECLVGFENLWESKKLNIETDIQEDVFISSDPELLMLVWNNLISNAIKFTDEGGTVSVSLKEKDGLITVSVADTGCGMSSETGKHIFEKFYQGDTSRSTAGNGLGLALVKRVIDILNCEISLNSCLGEGSTFSVRIRSEDNEQD